MKLRGRVDCRPRVCLLKGRVAQGDAPFSVLASEVISDFSFNLL